MSVYFVHCNICGTMPSSKISYFVASCGHIACQACVGKGLLNVCYICKKSGKITRLTPKMDDKIKRFFTDPTQMLQQLISDATSASAKKKARDSRLNHDNKSLMCEIDRLKAELAQKEAQIEQMKTRPTMVDISMESRKDNSFLVAPEGPMQTPVKRLEGFSEQNSGDRSLKRTLTQVTPVTPRNKGLPEDSNVSNHSVKSNVSRQSANSSGSSGIDLRFGPSKKKPKMTLAQLLSASAADKQMSVTTASPAVKTPLDVPHNL
ncbi:unnamed protein product [Bursaphelenchus xylophilus]|uniref:(pine wood nematode) hypothetical protein n=1 Tax=Bursaphelenchus xylophilus TaxID=6326 RepID=A0A1I7RP67_BURXY|nr:unnamed protein product [Bursaphelenchus xylophilus]CAG9124614.1 unnamed protein product [Bursaphelenchus xylophilus]